MTNEEKIKAMGTDELAKFLDNVMTGNIEIWHGFCDACDGRAENACWLCTKYWLETEAKECEKNTFSH